MINLQGRGVTKFSSFNIMEISVITMIYLYGIIYVVLAKTINMSKKLRFYLFYCFSMILNFITNALMINIRVYYRRSMT